MDYKSLIESMKQVSVAATDEMIIERDAWIGIIFAMNDMLKTIEKLQSRLGDETMDKKTKDALITIVRHVLESDKKTEDPAAGCDALEEEYNAMKMDLQKLQEQADIDKMQIALYDKENKELRKNYATLMEIVREVYHDAITIPPVTEDSVHARDKGMENLKAWIAFTGRRCVCNCKEERGVENRDS